MGGSSLTELSFPQKDLLEPLFTASKSSDLKETLEILIAIAKTDDGRADLASKNTLPAALKLITHLLNNLFDHEYLSLSLRLTRNLCAGEVANQKSFIELNGVGILLTVLRIKKVASSEPDCGIIRIGLQVLANVSLAGKEHQQAIWGGLFPDELYMLAKVRSQETCDPLCMIIYGCCDGSPELVLQLCGGQGLPIVVEIIRTASLVGFGEEWLKLLLSRICLEDIYFPPLFLENTWCWELL
ncbi:ATAXIN-10 [Salix purpurea]|uniref:ATAXIN-10 n=1 Tax=Salix purpurea TaxID=77065 RepID=A0A9Q0SJC0_SALPP|nr:ATAXIN-10 [Salix purpurea]